MPSIRHRWRGGDRAAAWAAVGLLACSASTSACGDDAWDAGRSRPSPSAGAQEVEDEEALDGPPASALPAGIELTGVEVRVIALDNSFRPQLAEAAVGDVVIWENRGVNDHDVLSVETGEWGAEVADFPPGATFSHVFAEPGEYRYFCSIHGDEEVGMVGTITVSD